jgi:hypothetical protein
MSFLENANREPGSAIPGQSAAPLGAAGDRSSYFEADAAAILRQTSAAWTTHVSSGEC